MSLSSRMLNRPASSSKRVPALYYRGQLPFLFAVSGIGLGALALLADTRPPASKPKSSAEKITAQTTSTGAANSNRAIASKAPTGKSAPQSNNEAYVALTGEWQRSFNFVAGKTVAISVHLEHPVQLPANGRIAVTWTLQGGTPEGLPSNPKPDAKPDPHQRAPEAFGIYTLPTANWRKVLHALDGDVYLVYRAPATGKYTLTLSPVTDEKPVGDAAPRWREKGNAPQLAALPQATPWPAGTVAPLRVGVSPIDLGTSADESRTHTILAAAPNDTPEQAQTILLDTQNSSNNSNSREETDVQTWEILGGADDVEFFDNGKMGSSGDDWFRLVYKGTEPRLLTAQLVTPNPQIAARIRVYRSPGITESPRDVVRPGNASLLELAEYKDGQDGNERSHQQDEEYRINVNRVLKPGDTYYLRVESNAPGYRLQLRLLKPAPYTDPRMAVRQAMYTQIGQVDAWLSDRPRGISVERRLRDTGNLLGTSCMSCHTQSGGWGPAVPLLQGYPLENGQNYWHMIDMMYECLRPTNQLKDAANNTSLAPLDLGDGPAGTRAAGFNVANIERWRKPSRLQSKQQVRTANYVMQTGDPGGINAAGPGSNIGFVIVNTMATDILKTAWEQSGDPKYFRKMQEKARQVLAVNPQYTDDVALRLDYFYRLFPIKSYIAWCEKADKQDAELTKTPPTSDKPGTPKQATKGDKPEDRAAFVERVTAQLKEDEARLRSIQQADGSWNFSPGVQSQTADGGKTWKPGAGASDPSPTALGITGLTSAGYGKDDPAIARAVKALLAMQDPSGRWNRAAQTGFVSTAYALHALSRLYPWNLPNSENPDQVLRLATQGKSILERISAIRTLAISTEPRWQEPKLAARRLTELCAGAADTNPQIRYWAMIGLGATHTDKGISFLVNGLGDRTKMVRDAAAWAMRHTLLDDRGWSQLLTAAEKGDDYTREAAWQALNMRADTVLPQSKIDIARLTALFDHAINSDPHPAVRAWASKAAWQWWVWNPPVRLALNKTWVRLLERPETDAEVENCVRYSSEMLFIVNGHKANGSREHQYKELALLFAELTKRLDTADNATKNRLARRLVGIGGTFYTTSGGDGGPGQMGYVTEGAGEMMGKATMLFLAANTNSSGSEKNGTVQLANLRAGLEGGANVPYSPLTSFLVDYSIKGPEELRKLAASAISDPRAVSVAAVPELVEPQLAQVKRGALEPPRRDQISEPIIELWAKVNWIVPKREEQQRAFFDLMIPTFPQYTSAAQIATIADAAERARVQREMDSAWYLADRMGYVLAANPDLHQEIILQRYFPTTFKSPLEELFWTRSVEWILTFTSTNTKTASISDPLRPLLTNQVEQEVPDLLSIHHLLSPQSLRKLNLDVCQQATDGKATNQAPDPSLIVKDRALQLYLDQLKPTANPKTRAVAIRMANQTALRTNPEVLRSLNEVLTFEKDPELVGIIQNVLKQSDGQFLPALQAALKAEKHPSVALDANGEPKLTEAQRQDILYFRDYLLPELTRQKRSDQQSCMGCHGVPGRVPSLGLKAPDKFGYLAVADMLSNYRTLQGKVNLTDIEKSKLLRKPLNIQDGKEDGHQGGRRYSPEDPGYLIIRKWVENQIRK